MVKVVHKNIAIGPNKGHVTTPVKRTEKQAKQVRQSRRKAVLGKRIKVVRQVISEVCGQSSYEKRILELLKTGGMKESKKALKIAKKSLGTHKRGKAKRESLLELLREQRKKQAH
jgi:large subunit ribosomal protein L36e